MIIGKRVAIFQLEIAIRAKMNHYPSIGCHVRFLKEHRFLAQGTSGIETRRRIVNFYLDIAPGAMIIHCPTNRGMSNSIIPLDGIRAGMYFCLLTRATFIQTSNS
ncbi:MAG TPA: hypothetical protein VKM55_18840 [Candidatus Lokiarchaeia archaeon]|nr:hypothetical protein [Candidatus Lokiarchaeia archaeon]